MKRKILQLSIGCLLFVTSCSEDFITKDLDKGRYVPSTFYNTKAHAEQAVNAAYSVLNGFSNGYASFDVGCGHFVNGDDLYQTGNAAGFNTWGSTSDYLISNNLVEVRGAWNIFYAQILYVNNALAAIPAAQAAANDPLFTDDVKNLLMGQVYFLRAYAYYNLAQYFGDDKVILRRTVAQSQDEFALAPQGADSTYNFIENDLKLAQSLLTNALNTTAGYDKGRVTRGAATALLGKFYINRGKYDKAAAEFKKLLPGVGDAAYGTYSLVPNYRDNFTKAGEKNNESIFEIEWANVENTGNEGNIVIQNFTLNRTSADYWWNFAVPGFKLTDGDGDHNGFESWTETINGTPTTVYDYRAYETFWGVPNGATVVDNNGITKDWQQQGWADETVAGEKGVLGIRKYSFDNLVAEKIPGQWDGCSDINFRMIRLADVMLLYAECMANLNPGNVSPSDPNSAVYWVDQVRTRANNVAVDQANLYSTRDGKPGQLPTATVLMAAKGWNLLRLIQHERYVEGYCEGWRKEDMLRWKVGADFVKKKSGWKGYQSLIFPVPQTELDNNPKFPQ